MISFGNKKKTRIYFI